MSFEYEVEISEDEYFDSEATLVKKDSLIPKPSINPLVATVAPGRDPTTLEMQQKLIQKQNQLLELKQKKIDLDILIAQVKLQEQLKKSSNDLSKKRPSIESSDCPSAKRSKSQIFDELFAIDDVDLRQQLSSVKSPIKERPPTINKIIISPGDEESIKNGKLSKDQESALMNKIIAQIKNRKLKEAQRKEHEDSVNFSLRTISDDVLDESMFGGEKVIDRIQSEQYGRQFDSRFRRGQEGNWRGNDSGFPGPIRPIGPGIDPWLKPLSPNQPLCRPPFMNPLIMHFDDEKPPVRPFDMKNNINESSDHNIMVNCLNRNNKSVSIDGEPTDIVFYDDIVIAFMTWEDPREISFQSGSRRVIFDDKDSYFLSFNEPYKDIRYNGHVHKVRLGAPTREIYIDGQYYECYIGGPGIEVYLLGQAVNVKIEGPPPPVVIGIRRRTDIVAGKISLIIDANTIIPIYLDARVQIFKLNGNMHSLKFIDALQTVLIDDVPFNMQFGGLPKPVLINNKKHFIRFSVLPRGIKPGYIKLRDMEGNLFHQRDNENSQYGFGYTSDLNSPAISLSKKVLRVGDISPDRNSNSPNAIFQQPNLGNLDTLISNVVAKASVQSQNENNTCGYQIENNHLQNNTENVPSVASLSSTLNINDLFQKLVASGIVTSTIAQDEVATNNEHKSTNQPIIGSSMTINSSIGSLSTMITLQSTISTLLVINALTNIDKPLMSHKNHSPTPSIVSDFLSLNELKKQETTLELVDFSKPPTLKVRQPNVIHALYAGMQCSSCGMRFPPENTILYSQHLVWHFRQNRKGKKNIKKASSRGWHYNTSDWHKYEEIEDLGEREKCYFENQQEERNDESNEEVKIPSIPADPNVPDAQCKVCFEKFEQYYNDENEEWHLRMAIRTENNVTCHPVCYEDYQKSLIASTLELIQAEESKENDIPGLEVDFNNSENKEIIEIIDDVESVHSNIKISEEKEEVKDVLPAESDDDDDDDVILNEVQPEIIILDEYEFKGKVDNDGIIQEMIGKQEPDDGFTDVENFKLEDVKIKTESNTSDDMIEDVDELDQDIIYVPSEELAKAVHPDFFPSMDGNFELNTGVRPSGIIGKIKINISKQLPVIAPKENKYISLEPIDLTQPLPPVELNLKTALQGIELKKLLPVKKGSELTGLCSIM